MLNFTQEDIESNDNGKLSNNTYIANIINKYKTTLVNQELLLLSLN